MFNLGFTELILLGAIALIFLGPQQLPEVARTIGKLLNEWKRATSDLTSTFTDNDAFRDWDKRRADYFAEIKKEEEEHQRIAEAAATDSSNDQSEAAKQIEMNLDAATTFEETPKKENT